MYGNSHRLEKTKQNKQKKKTAETVTSLRSKDR